MHGKTDEPGTLQTSPIMCEKEDLAPLDCDCMTRMMTPEEWEKYGPLFTSSKNM